MPSRTRAAINKGYGKGPAMGILTSLTPKRVKSPKGGKVVLKKGSPEAKEYMARLRSLRGRGSYTDAALKGYGSYTNAAMRGYGFSEILSPLTEEFGEGIGNLVKVLAKKLHTSLSDLATNPDKLLFAINQYAPSIFGKVKNFFNRIFKREKMPSKAEVERVKRYLEQQIQKKRRRRRRDIDDYDDDDEPKSKPKPRPRPRPKPSVQIEFLDSDDEDEVYPSHGPTTKRPSVNSPEFYLQQQRKPTVEYSYMDDIDY